MAETRLKITYSVTSTTNSTQLFKTSYFSQAELEDGTVLPSNIFDVGNHAYVFSATGNNVVFYTMTGSTLGNEAFEGMTRIVAVDIPSTVTTLGERCFRNCTNLSSVTLADTVSNFGEGVFDADVALESIVIPSTAVTMNSKVFRGCTSLTSITMSDTTAPAVSADTFYQVQTGGTLYYPAGSNYSAWLSNNQYYLGYYNWNGVSGSVQTLMSQHLSVSSSGLITTYDTSPANSVLAALRVDAVPFDSEPNIEWTIGHNDLNMTLCGNTVYDKGYAEQMNNYVNCRNLVYFDSTIDGYTDIVIRETNSNLTTNLRVINRLPGSNATPSVLPAPSAVTFSSSGCNYVPAPLEPVVIANIVCNGFNPDRNFVQTPHFLQTPDRWEDDIVSRPQTDFVLRDGLVIRLEKLQENTGGTRYWEKIYAYTPDTNVQITSGDKTTYVFKFHMGQEGSGSTPTPEPPIPSGITIGSGFTSWDMYYTGCPLVFDHSASTGTWSSLPSMFNINQTVSFSVPENDTDSARTITYYFNWYSGETCEDLIDTVSYTISQAAGSGDTPPSERSVYLDPTEKTFPASTNNTNGNNLRVLPSGCTIDSSYTPTYVSSADWLHADRHTWSSLNSGWTIYYGPDRNTTNQTREGYITVNGVHDTDGNVYNGLVCHVIQYSGSYVFANYTSSVSSAETDTTVEIVGINTNICSVTVSGFTGYPANRWEGFEQPSYTQLGNYITVHIPENDVTGSSRSVRFSAVTVYGESCENTERLLINIGQAKSGATPTPVQKDIKAADADYSVGSGTGNASTTIQTSGCTYDHFTYITGGSFSVTATSGPNNTIVFTYPENPTTSPRTGYVYITFYDSDGNTYGPQTITFTQQAGSSPGPGPGPDPETGYVLTTLTISDQEQHRYFVEARPGVVYSAAGQYYKTVLACEARYSLYYVNSYGGVDVLPFKEKGWKKSDTITRFNYSRSFRNNTPEFENVNYMNEIKASWELHTGWLSDEQSKRMHELIESTIVYLYDAEEKTYTPVVMTDKKLEYKTYHNQGKKFYNYTVNVEESQSRERR